MEGDSHECADTYERAVGTRKIIGGDIVSMLIRHLLRSPRLFVEDLRITMESGASQRQQTDDDVTADRLIISGLRSGHDVML